MYIVCVASIAEFSPLRDEYVLHLVQAVIVDWKPFWFSYDGTIPLPSTLSWCVTPTVDRLYTLSEDTPSMLNIWLWHEESFKQACP